MQLSRLLFERVLKENTPNYVNCIFHLTRQTHLELCKRTFPFFTGPPHSQYQKETDSQPKPDGCS